MKKARNILIILALALTPSLTHLSCGGDGDGGGQNGQTTIINGRVTNVVAMMEEDNRYELAKLLELLSFINEAKAKDGITVSVMVDGETVATDVTDPMGNFFLSFTLQSAQNVTLIFEIDGTIVSITIFVQQGSILDIIVAIDLNAPEGEEVEVVDVTDAEGPIRCENGILEIIKELNEDIVIDGGGEDCIRTAGNCELIIDPENIVLTNCQRCIDARGKSQVTLRTIEGHVFCDASEDGFRSRGTADILLEIIGDLNVSAFGHGARADGDSTISLFADRCIFDTGEDVFEMNGNALIDTEGCEDIIEGVPPLPQPTPGPSPEP